MVRLRLDNERIKPVFSLVIKFLMARTVFILMGLHEETTK